jgi:hypothetical protein
MNSLTWEQHEATGRELQYERSYLFNKLIPVLVDIYGKTNEPTTAAIEALKALDHLRMKLAHLVLEEHKRKINVTSVYFPDLNETIPGCASVFRERELP